MFGFNPNPTREGNGNETMAVMKITGEDMKVLRR
jgi:hypothetical protein